MALTDRKQQVEAVGSTDYIPEAIEVLHEESSNYEDEVGDFHEFISKIAEITPETSQENGYDTIPYDSSRNQVLEIYENLIMPEEYSESYKHHLETIQDSHGFEEIIYADMIDEFDISRSGDGVGMVYAIQNNMVNDMLKQILIKNAENSIKARKNVISSIEEEIEVLSDYDKNYENIDSKIESIANELDDSSRNIIDDAINLWPHVEIADAKIDELAYQRQHSLRSEKGVGTDFWLTFFGNKDSFTFPVIEELLTAKKRLENIKHENFNFVETNNMSQNL